MKKLLFLVALLFGFVACNSEEENENLELEKIDSTTEIANMIAEISDYDVNSVDQLLCNKRWSEDFTCQYTDDNWDEVEFDSRYDLICGHSPAVFYFHNDGTMEDFTEPEYPLIELPQVKSWAFDPETRTLTIGYINYHLTGLGEETLILDEINEIFEISDANSAPTVDYTLYIRDVFKARAIE